MSDLIVFDSERDEEPGSPEYALRRKVQILAFGGKEFYVQELKEEPSAEVAEAAEELKRKQPKLFAAAKKVA